VKRRKVTDGEGDEDDYSDDEYDDDEYDEYDEDDEYMLAWGDTIVEVG
jgi:hypothetical protein